MAGIDTRGIDRAALPEESFPATAHEFRVFVAESAFDRITTRGAADTTREIGGVLVGRACRDAGGPYVRIDATIDALHAEEKGTELTFTHATWDHVHREMDAKHPGAKIVGWYHTHPGFGVFLSDRDQFIQRSFFNLPSQVALVFDPVSREHGVFAWRDNEPVRVRRWWVGDREHIWDGAHPPRGAADPREGADMAKDERKPEAASEAAPAPDLFSVAFGVIVLLAVGGLAGWWIGQRGAQDAVAQAERAIAEQRVRDAVRDLNVELLGTLRRVVDLRARSAEIDEAIAEIDAAAKAVRGDDAAAKEQTARLARARSKLQDLRDAAPRLQQVLERLEAGLRAGSLNPREVERALQDHGQVLGQICAVFGESAARSGDGSQARLFFTLAARCDPGNSEIYRKRAEAPAEGTPK